MSNIASFLGGVILTALIMQGCSMRRDTARITREAEIIEVETQKRHERERLGQWLLESNLMFEAKVSLGWVPGTPFQSNVVMKYVIAEPAE